MPTKPKASKQGFNWKLPFGLVVLGLVGYYFTNGSDDTSKKAATTAATKPPSPGGDDLFLPDDYTASFQPLKVASKDAFKPLIYKVANADLKGSGLPTSITGGGDWSYDGTAAVDNKQQALMDETKTGESDFLSLGQHWKHGRVKKITDTEIVFEGDDGSSATLKMGDSSGVASKTPPPPPLLPNPNAAMQPPALAGNLDMTPLPPAFGNMGNGGYGRNGGFGGGRRGRGRRGGFGGFGG